MITGSSHSLKWRRLQLKRIEDILNFHENEILQALSSDLGKPPTEAFFEVIALRQELKLAQKNLAQWIKPKKVPVPMSLKPSEAFIQNEPLGCVLIIGPWNYPFSLTLQPLISALAAGNTVVLKPSEHAPATSKLIETLIAKHFPKEVVRVFTGDGLVAQALIEKSFDHIFFTGGGEIGKKIMLSASKDLTPVTLELGGKSPAIVLQDADLEVTARRLIWGKALNAGQTCIAPNHLLVEEKIKPLLIIELKRVIQEFFGSNPLASINLANIINDHHFKRLYNLLESARISNQILFGGDVDKLQNRISPALIDIQDKDDPLLAEEIFGPLIPILTIDNLDTALMQIRQQPKPLAIYMFGGSTKEQNKVLERTSSGGVCFNDVIVQAGLPELPFGGVGASGMGRYHGKAGFETFSNQKSVVKRPFWLDLKFRYPPYKLKISVLKNLFK